MSNTISRTFLQSVLQLCSHSWISEAKFHCTPNCLCMCVQLLLQAENFSAQSNQWSNPNYTSMHKCTWRGNIEQGTTHSQLSVLWIHFWLARDQQSHTPALGEKKQFPSFCLLLLLAFSKNNFMVQVLLLIKLFQPKVPHLRNSIIA